MVWVLVLQSEGVARANGKVKQWGEGVVCDVGLVSPVGSAEKSVVSSEVCVCPCCQLLCLCCCCSRVLHFVSHPSCKLWLLVAGVWLRWSANWYPQRLYKHD